MADGGDGFEGRIAVVQRTQGYRKWPEEVTARNRRNALFAGHDEGGRSWARFASLIGTCKMNGVEPYAYLVDLFTRLANGHLDKDIDALMPWAYIPATKPEIA